jgi:hypothetical protein
MKKQQHTLQEGNLSLELSFYKSRPLMYYQFIINYQFSINSNSFLCFKEFLILHCTVIINGIFLVT